MARIESLNDPVFSANLKIASSYCTVLLGSITDEIPLLSGGTDDISIQKLTHGGKIIAAHAGKAGAFVYTETGVDYHAAFPVNVVDTIGAGDAYNAGFLYGMLNHLSIHESNRLANAAAAYSIQRSGGRSGPDLSNLHHFLNAN